MSKENSSCCNNEPKNDCYSTKEQTKSTNTKMKFKKNVGIVILLLAVVIATVSAVKNENKETSSTDTEVEQADCSLPSINDFSWLETDENVAFLFLKGNKKIENEKISETLKNVILELNETTDSVYLIELEDADSNFRSVQNKYKITNLPSVVILGRGCQSSVISEKINSTNLIKAYIYASTPVSTCGSDHLPDKAAKSGCCPKK